MRYVIAVLEAEPPNEEERTEHLRLKRMTIKTLIEHVIFDKGRNLKVMIQLDVQETLKLAAAEAGAAVQTTQVEICNHKPASHARHLHAGRA